MLPAVPVVDADDKQQLARLDELAAFLQRLLPLQQQPAAAELAVDEHAAAELAVVETERLQPLAAARLRQPVLAPTAAKGKAEGRETVGGKQLSSRRVEKGRK